MIKVKILIEDEEYREALVNRLPFCDVSLGAEVVCSLDEGSREEDYLILTDRLPDEFEESSIDKRKIVYLSQYDDGLYENQANYISKYAPITDIVADLSQIYMETFGTHGMRNFNGVELISVCSFEESDISNISRFVARQISYIKQRKVLLMSLRDINPFVCDCKAGEFERLIYKLSKSEQICIEKFFYQDEYGVYCIRSNELINRISQMHDDEKQWFIKELCKIFQVIVLHIGCSLSKCNVEIIRNSDVVFCAGECCLDDILNAKKMCEIDSDDENEGMELKVVDYLNRLYGCEEE